MTNWTKKSLAEISSSCLGKMLDKKKNKGDYQPYLANLNVQWGEFKLHALQEMRFEKHEQERFGLKYGDLIICEGGEPGRCAVWRDEVSNMKVQKALHRLRVNSDYNSDFLYYRMKLAGKNKELDRHFIGTTIKHLTGIGLKGVEFDFPPIREQELIAKTLRTLDKKIELNNKINAELESMAKLIYDYWFVQFDFPDANGKPYKSSGGKLVYNEELKREIPDGWKVKTLLDIATFTNGIACQKHRPEEDEESYKVIKIREMGAGFTDKSEFVSQNIPNKVVVNDGDVLFSWSATLDVKIWSGGVGGLNQHIFKVTSDKYPRTYFYFEVLRYLQHFKMIAELRKTTMGHITQDHLKQSRISIAPKDLINALHEKLDPIINKTVKAKEENLKLQQLRDWLLPMLMNGQVTIK